jgi:hypothetical protein
MPTAEADSVVLLRPPGTAVPGFHMAPLRGWRSAKHSALAITVGLRSSP